MQIAQVAPLTEAVPPKYYGGTERVVAYLTDALVELGHEVTLFASGDSLTKAKLAPIWPRALRLDPSVKDYFAPVFMELETVARRAQRVRRDSLASGLFWLSSPAAAQRSLGDDFAWSPRSAGAAGPVRAIRGRSGGVDIRLAAGTPGGGALRGDDLSWPAAGLVGERPGHRRLPGLLGRISPKRRRTPRSVSPPEPGMRLKIAAKIDRVDEEYFKTSIEAFVVAGACGIHRLKSASIKRANFSATPRDCCFRFAWREPFGLVMIEAMACGTPVLALITARCRRSRGRHHRVHRAE